jgi:8-oxo-dGTP pyrophosphatase MutT (NUDIX family)
MIESLFRNSPIYCRIPYTLIELRNSFDQTLVVRRSKPPYRDYWNFLGGKIETGESPKLSAIRELVEETGIKRSDRSIRFCGIALWPADENTLLGMYLFKSSVRSKNKAFRQMAIDSEGIYSWLDLAQAEENEPVVPNAKVLRIIFGEGCEKNPIVLVHEVLEGGGCKYFKSRLAPAFERMHVDPYIDQPMQLECMTIPHSPNLISVM